MKNKITKLIIVCSLVFTIFLSVLAPDNLAQAATKIPKPDAIATQKNVLALLKKYDKDSYEILKAETDFMNWYSSRSTILENLDTAVHESTHGYTHDFGTMDYDWDKRYWIISDCICLDKDTKYLVTTHQNTYHTCEMAKTIPNELRTFRYDTYIAQDNNMSSNQYGNVGLMNEFCAYYRGLKVMVNMLPYMTKYKDYSDCWNSYAMSLGNDMNAYAEFKFWILEYMLYAKENYPKLYKELLADKVFCSAYKDLETRFASTIKECIEGLSDLPCKITVDDEKVMYWQSNYGGPCVDLDAYHMLTKQMKKKKYVNMDKKIKAQAK